MSCGTLYSENYKSGNYIIFSRVNKYIYSNTALCYMISVLCTPHQSGSGMKEDVCLRCGWAWFRRSPEEPRVCPHCHSPYWFKERVRPVKKKEV